MTLSSPKMLADGMVGKENTSTPRMGASVLSTFVMPDSDCGERSHRRNRYSHASECTCNRNGRRKRFFPREASDKESTEREFFMMFLFIPKEVNTTEIASLQGYSCFKFPSTAIKDRARDP